MMWYPRPPEREYPVIHSNSPMGTVRPRGVGATVQTHPAAEGSLDMNQNCLLLAQDPLSSALGCIFPEDIGNTLENEWWGGDTEQN